LLCTNRQREKFPVVVKVVGCFEDYMDFREEVDKISKKQRAKEAPNVGQRSDDAETLANDNRTIMP
jgi:hypothetical protein